MNFLFVKPDELEQQIRRRAQTKFKVHSGDKKTKSVKQKLEGSDIDPHQLQLIEGTFVIQNVDTNIKQLPMHEVGTHRAGIAFGRTSDVLPLIREGKSLSLDGLAVLTTSRIPPMEQGLLPVVNLRYPAIYVPTMEPILLEGSLVNFGDLTVVRKQEEELIPTESIDTGVLKIAVYKDEWNGDWDQFIKSPLKLVFQKHPLFTLCSGHKCGGNCPRYHPPVDIELDSVVMDLWARSWLSLRGKKVNSDSADIFQVLVRVPDVLLGPLQKLSGQGGVYIEPRQTGGRGPDIHTTVIWLPNSTLSDALHKLRITEKGIAVARFAHRYGVRVPTRDAEHIHTQLNPETPFSNFEVSKVFELRPVPHGTQKIGILNMLKAWKWKARPLQPSKADAQGMGWLVGAAEDPPSLVMPTSTGDIVISLHKEHGDGEHGVSLTSSSKTQGHLRKQQRQDQKTEATPSSSATPPPGLAKPAQEPDPWTRHDPWGGWKNPNSTPMEDEPMVKSMASSLEDKVISTVQKVNEDRFQKLEVDIAEIRMQHGRHEQWFQEAGNANQRLQSQVNHLATQMTQQQNEVSSLSQEIKSGFQNMEALLSKKQRLDD